MTHIDNLNAALIAANVRFNLHRRSGDTVSAVEAWDDAERIGLQVFMAEEAQRFAEMRDASMAEWDVLKGHPDHCGRTDA